jgi:hypothetical protein
MYCRQVRRQYCMFPGVHVLMRQGLLWVWPFANHRCPFTCRWQQQQQQQQQQQVSCAWQVDSSGVSGLDAAMRLACGCPQQLLS